MPSKRYITKSYTQLRYKVEIVGLRSFILINSTRLIHLQKSNSFEETAFVTMVLISKPKCNSVYLIL